MLGALRRSQNKQKSGPVILTVKIRFSGREASSLEALRFPSLAPPLLSTRDGIVNVGPEAETVKDERAQGRLRRIVDR